MRARKVERVTFGLRYETLLATFCEIAAIEEVRLLSLRRSIAWLCSPKSC